MANARLSGSGFGTAPASLRSLSRHPPPEVVLPAPSPRTLVSQVGLPI